MAIDYIVVQAGGKGTRLAHLTKNKPKALVPVENLPMLFHLFRKFPDKKYVIIGDYHKEVLREYLSAFSPVDYQMVEAEGSGTCSGLQNALSLLPDGQEFMLIWSDLILPATFVLPEQSGNYIGISQSFRCRWSYENGAFVEEPSQVHGVAGLFIFPEKSVFQEVPSSGELVRWLSQKKIPFQEIGLSGTREFGIFSEYQALEQTKCRPFNEISVKDGIFTKKPLDKQGRDLAEREKQWYRYVSEKNLSGIPTIFRFDPLQMEEIKGRNIYECQSLSLPEKREILVKLVHTLQEIHALGEIPVDRFSLKEAYFKKTMDRLGKIRDLLPFASEKSITINGKPCRNVFFLKQQFEQALDKISCEKFVFLHGDCTFSNMMLREDGTPVIFDPRGYFGKTELFGDPNYDWAKLYYSLVGNYDPFNLKEFSLDILENEIKIQLTSNGWEALEDDFFQLTGCDPSTIRLIHAVIWLSLTTYAWQDYDSICAAFYLGLYHLEDYLP